MRFLTLTFLLGAVLAAVITMSGVCFAGNTSKRDCVSFAEARQHLGTTACVTGTVLHVEDGTNGVTFLNFCKDYQTCPFTVVVFPGDLKKVGDIRQLEGRQIEIKGTIERLRRTGGDHIAPHPAAGRKRFRSGSSGTHGLRCRTSGSLQCRKVQASKNQQDEAQKTGAADFDRRSGRAT